LLGTTRTSVSPWLEVISKEIQFLPHSRVETYYAIGQQHYLVGLAVTPNSRILLVRQYRPAIERFSLEFPGGLLEEGKTRQSPWRASSLKKRAIEHDR
jgi:ADP-ribose pyrophosphatase